MKIAMFAATAVVLLASCAEDVAPVVRTLNAGYDRALSRVLVRHVEVPTRANLDYAAWNANMILLDTAEVVVHPARVTAESLLAGGLLSEVRTRLEDTPLSDSERAAPMAWKPVEDLWLAWSFDSAGPLVSKVQELSQKRWGDTSGAYLPFQQIVALHLHRAVAGDEIWVRVEFSRWMSEHLDGIEDRDGDGFPEVWAKLSAPELGTSMVALLRGDYSTKILGRDEAVQWANELAALWYPVHNTDMLDLSREKVFPQAATEPEVVKELAGLRVEDPIAVMRGRPFGIPLYLVLEASFADRVNASTAATAGAHEGRVDSTLPTRLEAIRARLAEEIGRNGGSWAAWAERSAPARDRAQSLEESVPAQVQAIAGPGGALLFRRELSYVRGAGLDSLPAEENPVARIASLRDSLAGLGIDFLFVPVPTKLDVEPGLLGHPGDGVVQPWSRKLLDDLAAAGVETVDLHAALSGKGLWRKQDTHWKPAGAQAAAEAVAVRIREYSWFPEAARDSLGLMRRDTSWKDFGDLRDRLDPAVKAGIAQEEVRGPRFHLPDGKPYDDVEGASILLIGDSYLGVYQKVPPRAAGFSSHLAATLGTPVSVVMGWGGGPEAPRKLAARGPDGLKGRRLVVWIMSVRDLFRFPGGWKAR